MSKWVTILADDKPYLVFDASFEGKFLQVNTATTCSVTVAGLRYAYVPEGAKLKFANRSDDGVEGA